MVVGDHPMWRDAAARGLSCKQMAEPSGGLSPYRSENHGQNTLSKLHLHIRVELVRYAIEHGPDSVAREDHAAREDR